MSRVTKPIHERSNRQAACRPAPRARRTPARQWSLKNILVPIDFSDASTEALHAAELMAKDYGAVLSLLHVVELEAYTLLANTNVPPGQVTFGEAAMAALADLRRKENGAGVEINLFVRIGHPQEEILTLARNINADLIVMATHGRSGFEKLMLGSTAERVVRHSPCPVLTLKKPEPKECYGHRY